MPATIAASWSPLVRSSCSDIAMSKPSADTTSVCRVPGTVRTKLSSSQPKLAASVLSAVTLPPSMGRWNERLRSVPGSPRLSLLCRLGRFFPGGGVLRRAIRRGHRTVGRRRGVCGCGLRSAASRSPALEAREPRAELLRVALVRRAALRGRDLGGRGDRRRRALGERLRGLDDLRAVGRELAELGE